MEGAGLSLSLSPSMQSVYMIPQRRVAPPWQEDVHVSLFMWERDESITETMRERLEINSTCVFVRVQMVNFLSLQFFSVAGCCPSF